MAREFHYRWSWTLPAGAERLWPLVSDTNRFNRDAGLPPVVDARAPDEQLPNARRRLRIRVAGVAIEWEELPFEWHRPWRFGVVRRYSRGPLEEMRVLADLEPLGPESTRLVYDVVARPRGLFGLVAIPLQIGVLSRFTFGRVFKRYARVAARDPHPTVPSPDTPPPRHRLEEARRRLVAQEVAPEVAERLVEHVAGADDLTLARMRPYELADRWDQDRRRMLESFLLGTRAGVFDLSWDILCPVCAGAKDQASTLRDLRMGMAHCDTCQIEFSVDFDQSVELSFHPSRSLRDVEAPPFCVAGPQITPQVEVQQLLAAGETRSVRPVMEEGRHRIRAFGIPGGPSFRVEEGGDAEGVFVLNDDGWLQTPDCLRPDARLALENRSTRERLVDVERTAWGDTAVTAAEVTAMPRFRDLFHSEVLTVGDFARVGNLAVLFTDLKDSTRLYRRIGDAPAFGRVMRHFDVLHAALETEDGALVKTIGDAVMAVFRSPDAALRAVLGAQRALAEAGGSDGPLVLKAGIHFGPCIAVTLNERLDYFGTTVNVAARLGGLSGGDDVVISDAVRTDPDVADLLDELGATVVSTSSRIQGLEKPMVTWRVTFPRAT